MTIEISPELAKRSIRALDQAFERGGVEAAKRIAAIEAYNTFERGDPCPYPIGSAEAEAFDRGWRECFSQWSREP